MKVLIYLFLVLQGSSVSAKEFSLAFDDGSPAEFFANLKAKKEIAELRQQCARQERESQFPNKCMVLARRRLLKFSKPSQWKQVWDQISARCVRFVEDVDSLKTLELILLEPLLGQECREKVRSRVADLEYIAKKSKELGNLAPILNSIPP